MDNNEPRLASFYMRPTPIPKFRIGDRIKHKSGLCPSFKIDRIVDMHYVGENDEHVGIAVQDNWELVEKDPNDLDDAANDYALNKCGGITDDYSYTDRKYGFKGGANWQKERLILKACKCYCDDICERGMSNMCFHKHDGKGQVKNDFKYNECNELKMLIKAMEN
jgi:hypothetical protein